jgi:lipopolysaccharide transport system permease protein
MMAKVEDMKTTAAGLYAGGDVVADAGPRGKPAPLPAVTRLSGGPVLWLREIVARRDLLMMLAWREIKVKYKQSVMGFMWAILMPALIVAAGVIVKFAFASISGKPLQTSDLISVTVRSVPWAFFVASVRFGSVSLLSNSNLVTKIYMPRVIFPLSAVLSQLLDFAVAAAVVTVFLIFTGAHLTMQLLWLPVLITILIMFVTGVAIFISAAALFFRDVKYIVEVIITFAIFFTPVFYDVSMFGRWTRVLLLNPVAPLLEGISAAVLGRPLPYGGWVLYSAAASVAAIIGALVFFKRAEPYFAEAV